MSAIVSLLGYLSQALQQLGLGGHHLREAGRRWWRNLLLAVVAGSVPWLRCGINFDFDLVLLILVLFRWWWSGGSAPASPCGWGRCLALSCELSTASSAGSGNSLLLGGFLETVHQVVGPSDGHPLGTEIGRKLV
jgi:hypothetical protein